MLKNIFHIYLNIVHLISFQSNLQQFLNRIISKLPLILFHYYFKLRIIVYNLQINHQQFILQLYFYFSHISLNKIHFTILIMQNQQYHLDFLKYQMNIKIHFTN